MRTHVTFLRRKCVILPLVLKGKWYDMIASGEKREEYRDYSAYWEKRINNWCDKRGLHVVEFRLGYAKDAPKMWFTVGEVFLRREAHTHTWGEPPGTHFAIVLKSRVELIDDKKECEA